MSGAVQLAASRRLRNARAEMDAQRIASAVIQAKGSKGDKGDRGPKGDAPAHEWKGTQLRFEQPEGGWGALVDLQGPKGGRGSRGASGQGGGGGGDAGTSPFDLSNLPAADNSSPDEFIVRQGDVWARANYEQMAGWLGGGGAHLGGAPKWPAIRRVLVWGSLAMAVTALVGRVFGVLA